MLSQQSELGSANQAKPNTSSTPHSELLWSTANDRGCFSMQLSLSPLPSSGARKQGRGCSFSGRASTCPTLSHPTSHSSMELSCCPSQKSKPKRDAPNQNPTNIGEDVPRSNFYPTSEYLGARDAS